MLRLVRTLICFSLILVSGSFVVCPSHDLRPQFKVLALAENGGHHIKYTQAAKVWLNALATKHNFTVDYIENSKPIDADFLNQYQVFLQLDFPPYSWSEKSMHAFKQFMQSGKGGWVGFHHASLLGEFDGYPMWNWFSDFMGGIRWKNYIATFATANVVVEDKSHPVMKGISSTFKIENEEWYTYDKSPRKGVHVIATVDESSYAPDSEIKMGDHPVIWTNENMKTRNVYIFMDIRLTFFRMKCIKPSLKMPSCGLQEYILRAELQLRKKGSTVVIFWSGRWCRIVRRIHVDYLTL